MMGGFSAFGPPTPQAHMQMSISMGLPPMSMPPPHHSPRPHEYFAMPPPQGRVPAPGPSGGNVSPLAGYFPHIPSPLSLAPSGGAAGNNGSMNEPRDYFSGAVPPAAGAASASASSTLSIQPARMGTSSTSTVPSSSEASSPQIGSSIAGGFGRDFASSRGTSLHADADLEKPENLSQKMASTRSSSADRSNAVSQHLTQQRSLSGSSTTGASSRGGQRDPYPLSSHSHLRAKSQSPMESAIGGGSDDGSLAVPSLLRAQNLAQPSFGGTGGNGSGAERRMSWTDLSGLQRSIAQMSLEGKRDLNAGGARSRQ